MPIGHHSVSGQGLTLDAAVVLSCSVVIFPQYLPFMTATLKTKVCRDVAAWKGCSNLMLKKLNYLQPVICMVFGRCHYIALENLKYPRQGISELAVATQAASVPSLETSAWGPFSALLMLLARTASFTIGIEHGSAHKGLLARGRTVSVPSVWAGLGSGQALCARRGEPTAVRRMRGEMRKAHGMVPARVLIQPGEAEEASGGGDAGASSLSVSGGEGEKAFRDEGLLCLCTQYAAEPCQEPGDAVELDGTPAFPRLGRLPQAVSRLVS